MWSLRRGSTGVDSLGIPMLDAEHCLGGVSCLLLASRGRLTAIACKVAVRTWLCAPVLPLQLARLCCRLGPVPC